MKIAFFSAEPHSHERGLWRKDVPQTFKLCIVHLHILLELVGEDFIIVLKTQRQTIRDAARDTFHRLNLCVDYTSYSEPNNASRSGSEHSQRAH